VTDLVNFDLRELRPNDGCTSLSLGDATFIPLKSFLRKEAKNLHQSDLAKTFVLTEHQQTKVLAYITTLCTHISIEQFEAHDQIKDFKYKYYPAIKLARLAVDRSLKSNGIGSHLIDFVIALAIKYVMPHTGCRLLLVEAKSKSVGFYERIGFKNINKLDVEADQPKTMFLDLHRISQKFL
jgi:GNAT superfamily N-acetyltransferase